MLVEVGAKALKIVLNKEDAEELRNSVLHRQIPGQHDGREQQKADDGETAEKNLAIAAQNGIRTHHQHSQRRSHRAFRQRAPFSVGTIQSWRANISRAIWA